MASAPSLSRSGEAFASNVSPNTSIAGNKFSLPLRTVTKLRIRLVNAVVSSLLVVKADIFCPIIRAGHSGSQLYSVDEEGGTKNTTQLMAESTWSGNVFLAVSNPPSLPPLLLAGDHVFSSVAISPAPWLLLLSSGGVGSFEAPCDGGFNR